MRHPISRNLTLAAVAAALVAGGSPIRTAFAQDRAGEVAVVAQPEQTYLVQGENGEMYVGIWVQAPRLVAVPSERAPMSVALVIDRSGSMAGDKIVNARMAASNFIANLRHGDTIALYAFDSTVYQISAPVVVNEQTRAALLSSVSMLQPGSSTNMYGGVSAAISALSSGQGSDAAARRVVLVSDGLANVGPSSPQELGDLAARGTEFGIQVTAIGVGLEYSEQTLSAMAMRSAGRFYHLAEPAQMPTILARELSLMTHTVASNAFLELVPADGVEILGGEGVEIRRSGNQVEVPLGSLYSEQQRQVLVRVRVPTGGAGRQSIGAVRLRYQTPRGRQARVTERPLAVTVGSSRAQARESRVDRVVALASTVQSARVAQQAGQLLNAGRAADAARVLDAQARAVRAQSAQLGSVARAEAERTVLRLEGNSRRAREAAAAPASAAPAAARGASLDIQSGAMHSLGY